MSGNLKKRRQGTLAEERHKIAQDTTVRMLGIQLQLSGSSLSENVGTRLKDPYACGYLFGFADAHLQKAIGLEADIESMALMSVIYARLFGVVIGPKLFGASMRMQGELEFVAGRKLGGDEVFAWYAHEDPNAPPPFGLFDHLTVSKTRSRT